MGVFPMRAPVEPEASFSSTVLRSHDRVNANKRPDVRITLYSDPKAGLYCMVRAFDVDGPCTMM